MTAWSGAVVVVVWLVGTGKMTIIEGIITGSIVVFFGWIAKKIWAAARTPKDRVIIILGSLLLVGLGVYTLFPNLFSRDPSMLDASLETRIYVKAHRVSSDGKNLIAIIDSHHLLGFSDSHRLMVICRLGNNAKIDPVDDKEITKSALYEIVDGDVGTETELKELRMGPSNVQCFLSIIPRSVPPNEVDSIRYLKEHGGMILQPFGIQLMRVHGEPPKQF